MSAHLYMLLLIGIAGAVYSVRKCRDRLGIPLAPARCLRFWTEWCIVTNCFSRVRIYQLIWEGASWMGNQGLSSKRQRGALALVFYRAL